MTLQEKELLTRFLQQLASAQAGRKDTEAEALIREAVARQPDAAYLLVQRALQLEQLLQASQEQLKNVQTELDQTRSASSGSGRFLDDPNAWGRPAQQPQPAQPPSQQPLGYPASRTTAMRPAAGGSWSSGLFGNIAATAAGVVAGSFLFQGIQGLMNRGESQASADSPSATENTLDQARHDEPELLNSHFAPESDADSTNLAEFDDSGDFA